MQSAGTKIIVYIVLKGIGITSDDSHMSIELPGFGYINPVRLLYLPSQPRPPFHYNVNSAPLHLPVDGDD